MVMAMALLGLVFGVALTATVALFAVLSMEGGFQENLRAVGAEALRRITGRAVKAGSTAAVRSPEADARIRQLAEEGRVLQKLLDQTRGERDEARAEIGRLRAAVEESAALVRERDARLLDAQAALQAESARVLGYREQAGARDAEILRLKTEVKDLETELSVAQSGLQLTEPVR